MGNQREIIQIEPAKRLGVVLCVIVGESDKVRCLIQSRTNHYIYFIPEGEPIAFPNLDGPEVDLGIGRGDHAVIQSGGKMWCGYESFVEMLRLLAPSVENVLFYVGDDADYIDEFRIRGRSLEYERVHHGGWLPIEDYLAMRPR